MIVSLQCLFEDEGRKENRGVRVESNDRTLRPSHAFHFMLSCSHPHMLSRERERKRTRNEERERETQRQRGKHREREKTSNAVRTGTVKDASRTAPRAPACPQASARCCGSNHKTEHRARSLHDCWRLPPRPEVQHFLLLD